MAALVAMLVAGCATVLVAGCATMVRGPHVGSEQRVVATSSRLRAGDPLVATRQQGAILTVHAQPACDEVEREQVVREHTWERVNATPAVTTLEAVGGAALVAGGLWLTNGDPSVRGDEEVTTGEQVGGITMLLGGGVALTMAAVDVVRAWGTETRATRFTRDGRVLRRGVPCPDGTLPAQRVSAAGPGGAIPLGSTHADGFAVVDLVDALPRRLLVGPRPASDLGLVVDGRAHGAIDLAPVRAALEERTWTRIDVAQCVLDPIGDVAACAPLERYLADFPDGEHAEEATSILDEVASVRGAYEEARRAQEEAQEQEQGGQGAEDEQGDEARARDPGGGP